ncbi:hypothetical protein BaRGS_00012773 [Batillaria attramentaria]|uniref:Uncharacterized protein n=1 Tax=Batillaria attramentaria TaxID=370345 RepID=A0ABD0L9M0_9CAEN
MRRGPSVIELRQKLIGKAARKANKTDDRTESRTEAGNFHDTSLTRVNRLRSLTQSQSAKSTFFEQAAQPLLIPQVEGSPLHRTQPQSGDVYHARRSSSVPVTRSFNPVWLHQKHHNTSTMNSLNMLISSPSPVTSSSTLPPSLPPPIHFKIIIQPTTEVYWVNDKRWNGEGIVASSL